LPFPVEAFVGVDGNAELGVRFDWRLNGPRLTVDLVNGENAPFLADAATQDRFASVVRLAYEIESSSSGVALGFSRFAGKFDGEKRQAALNAIDVMYRVGEVDVPTFLVQVEAFSGDLYLDNGTGGFARETGDGAYVYIACAIGAKWLLGVRYDWNDHTEDPDEQRNRIGLYLTSFAEPSLRLRVGVERIDDDEEPKAQHTFVAQATWAFGADSHAHD
jgi:hypothetical protein